jgi:hypothetical protein
MRYRFQHRLAWEGVDRQLAVEQPLVVEQQLVVHHRQVDRPQQVVELLAQVVARQLVDHLQQVEILRLEALHQQEGGLVQPAVEQLVLEVVVRLEEVQVDQLAAACKTVMETGAF